MRNHRNKHSAFQAEMTVLCYCWLKTGQDKIKEINSASCICGQQWNWFVQAENGTHFLSFLLPWSHQSHYFVYGQKKLFQPPIWTMLITQVHGSFTLWRESEQDRLFYCLHLSIIWHNRLSCKKNAEASQQWLLKKFKWNTFEKGCSDKMLLFPNFKLHFYQ